MQKRIYFVPFYNVFRVSRFFFSQSSWKSKPADIFFLTTEFEHQNRNQTRISRLASHFFFLVNGVEHQSATKRRSIWFYFGIRME